ncbi:EscU/YscU/HrcU family type III secretion system export apparatus switch protein [Mangrovitalea sediminis]|uniref:EscU/YscU/HrcU family type III secretion system export apparatus switch protein n=1 Tax=Mangrovitalea sediminis TaxID=1982043 RepID=UPI000BE5A24B|nr:EscU/YscU/HrcU family type III secretion system export apparatus switch protein [Mangrovitalea sediminis]
MSTNKNTENTAVALKYDGQRAPEVTATGRGALADQIIRLAREHGIPLYENPELVDILARLDLGEEIPETLYRIVAEILAFAFHIQGRVPEGFAPPDDSPKPS